MCVCVCVGMLGGGGRVGSSRCVKLAEKLQKKSNTKSISASLDTETNRF